MFKYEYYYLIGETNPLLKVNNSKRNDKLNAITIYLILGLMGTLRPKCKTQRKNPKKRKSGQNEDLHMMKKKFSKQITCIDIFRS